MMRASRSRTREATNLLTPTPDEFVLGVACFLLTATDLLSLRLSCNERAIPAPWWHCVYYPRHHRRLGAGLAIQQSP